MASSILYVETNYPVGFVKGQDPASDSLASPNPRAFRLALPSICFMEALTVLNVETKSRNKFLEELSSQFREAGRDGTSPGATSLVVHLERARDDPEDWLGEFRERQIQCLTLLALHPELIPLDAAAVLACLPDTTISEPTDRLILHAILAHACASDPGPKAFLSANKNDFGQPASIQALEAAGVRYFSSSQAAIGWLTSQSGS